MQSVREKYFYSKMYSVIMSGKAVAGALIGTGALIGGLYLMSRAGAFEYGKFKNPHDLSDKSIKTVTIEYNNKVGKITAVRVKGTPVPPEGYAVNKDTPLVLVVDVLYGNSVTDVRSSATLKKELYSNKPFDVTLRNNRTDTDAIGIKYSLSTATGVEDCVTRGLYIEVFKDTNQGSSVYPEFEYTTDVIEKTFGNGEATVDLDKPTIVESIDISIDTQLGTYSSAYLYIIGYDESNIPVYSFRRLITSSHQEITGLGTSAKVYTKFILRCEPESQPGPQPPPPIGGEVGITSVQPGTKLKISGTMKLHVRIPREE
jgi:hypothetical protein